VIVVEVEEELVLEDWATYGTAKVVIAEVLRCFPAKGVWKSIQVLILKILVYRSMEAVRAPLTDLVV
jgi:hypothetical protein